ncbi:type II toxin-antitoxin system HicB family antitoxin [Listeria booriae]|uniref:type II toxin-antitoxin system HicB family antitoxin n=1 Tax=Listeria booriae TaxID=1552123 RepID=UPI001625825F|nr:type II toxin-antitoxin system HicB family antitoxin [Listeria booriae]MBC1274209.1 HicB family protein [Listeria booriae]
MAVNIVYPATLEQDGDYILVRFPDIPEAMTQGQTLEEAFDMAEEVLGLCLEDQKNFPEPSPVRDIRKKFPNKEVALIGLDLAAYRRKYHSKSIRKNVTIPEWIANMAEEDNINFSQTLTEALKEKLCV